MKLGTRLFLIVLGAVLGVWLWTILAPNPDRVIRKRLAQVAQAASFAPGSSYLSNLAGAQRLADFFATNVEVRIDVPGHETQRLSSREELFQTDLGARAAVKSLSVSIPDVTLIIQPDKKSAIADLTLEAKIAGDSDMMIQELKLTLKKIDGTWLITRVETVQTLQGGAN